ncbi:MAG: hypothetical protein KDK27_10415 [Leptospiraceae bacterium]|nr:hypothetical protein [Leptospiraceae bacterium]
MFVNPVEEMRKQSLGISAMLAEMIELQKQTNAILKEIAERLNNGSK